jgi:hypothetical protein
LIFGSVEDIYIGDLKIDPNVNKRSFKYVEDKNGHYYRKVSKCYGYPSKHVQKELILDRGYLLNFMISAIISLLTILQTNIKT